MRKSLATAHLRFYQYHFGYTLLELLVVLVIIGLLAGVATPQLVRMYDSVQAAYQREDIAKQINALGYQALQQGRAFSLQNYPNDDATIPLDFPNGWQLTTHAPIHYYTNGVCGGGEITLIYQTQRFVLQLPPPFCQMRWS